MSSFLEALHFGRVLLMDGAMGTELQRAGIQPDECYELWNLTHPDRVRAIHQAYMDAGAEVLLTNTFQANPVAFERQGLPRRRLQAVNRAALEIARSVAGPGGWVLADIGPLGDGKTAAELPFAPYLEVVRTLCHADAVLVETCSHWETLAKVASTNGALGRRMTILVSFTYGRDTSGKLCTRSGHSPEDIARAAKTCRVAALGVNCGRDIGMDEIIEIVRRYRRVTDLPLFARPNAGTPQRAGDHLVYPYTPERMAARLPELLEAGITLIGGCCGTTPAHIAAFRSVVEDWNARHRSKGDKP
jgi:5-methyltetrahydrofolate--homocysteine methyltransferase